MDNEYREEYVVEEKSNKGCLWGCLGCGGFVLFILLLGGYYVYNKVMPDEPLPTGTFTATQDEIDNMKSRLEAIKSDPEEGQPKAIDLKLSEKELNTIGLIAMENQPEIKVFDTKVEDNIITARLSIKPDKDRERYFNVIYKGTFALTESSIDMRPEFIKFGNFELADLMNQAEGQSPEEMEAQIRGELAKLRYEHGVIIKELSVKDGKAIIKVEKDPDFVEKED